eukprot:TRINITY_DN5794_c0_g1_i1.p1 TRINITY_DN5794_c0_g1~~TRINITY_DN5794_c0_g1_i1.p1  ORF type:complete len:535 (+),score=188.33 TRINITY_DN5794_c0_g1_i1:79-1605(+)
MSRKSISAAAGQPPAAPPAPVPEIPVDPAETMFEPTGDLFKDYCAYCEIEEKEEREDILDCISLEDQRANPRNAQTPDAVHTVLFVRGLEGPLHKKDISPLTNAIPHCSNLYDAKFFSCQLSVDSWKLLVEAVYKSASIITLHVDFNPGLTRRDPTVGRREGRTDHLLWPQQARGGKRDLQQAKPGKDAKGKPPAKGKPEEEAAVPITPIRTPDGWDAALLTFVKDLSLRGDAIDDAQCKLLAKGLERCTELLSLNLWGNLIGDSGAKALGAALRVNQRLTALNLGDNRVGDAGIIALADSLKQQDLQDPAEGQGPFRALRAKVRVFVEELPEDPPQYPTFTDLAALAAESGKDAKKPPPKGKKGAAVGRPEDPWDRDCVRVEESLVRVPGNRSLWSLNVSNNKGITAAGLSHFAEVLLLGVPPPPPPEEAAPAAGADKGKDAKRKSMAAEDIPQLPPPPCNSQGCALERLLLQHSALPAEAFAVVTEAIGKLRAARGDASSQGAGAA